MFQAVTKMMEQAPQSRLNRFHNRLLTMCVVETTAASQSGMNSWKTEPCRVLLRILNRLDRARSLSAVSEPSGNSDLPSSEPSAR